MNYKQIEEFILNIPKFRKEGNIEQARKFYEFLGKPGKSAAIVHVAGTNGKGSTCAYMNSVLTEAGYKVGMFTSPHLVSVRERIRIGSILISELEFEIYFQKLVNYIDESEKGKNYAPTFYEFLFFMAMLYFEAQKTNIIILETGLGGRLDATNVIDAPKVAVITEIGKDHMEYLGNTFEKIAKEKAGIVKTGSCVVYSANRQETARVIERKAKDVGALCKCVEKLGKQDYRFVDKKIDFSFCSRYYGYIPITLNTCATYQIENAVLALTALEELEPAISQEAIQRGMQKCKWEGRMEEILPGVYLDGAHNEDGIDAFVTSVKEKSCKGNRWLLFSAAADKEYKNMKEKLLDSDLFSYIYAAPLKNTRGITKKELEKIFCSCRMEEKDNCENQSNNLRLRNNIEENNNRKNELEALADKAEVSDNKEVKIEKTDLQVRISDSACEGLQEILSLKEENDLVYVTGSLYLVGEIKERYEYSTTKS